MLPKGVDYFSARPVRSEEDGRLGHPCPVDRGPVRVATSRRRTGLRVLWVPNSSSKALACGLASLWPLGTITDMAVPLLYLIFRQLVAWLGSSSYHRPSHGTRAAPIVPAAWHRSIRRGVTGATTVNLLGLVYPIAASAVCSILKRAGIDPAPPAMAPPGDKSWPPKHRAFSPPTCSASIRCWASGCISCCLSSTPPAACTSRPDTDPQPAPHRTRAHRVRRPAASLIT
jgi:hypothetical protein